MTYTYLIMRVSQATYDEIAEKLYHLYRDDEDGGVLDMRGIALALEAPPAGAGDP